MTSPYISNTDADRKAMLESTGVASVADLFLEIPEPYRDPPLDLPTPLSEFELIRELRALSLKNANLDDYACFLGAGSYNHYIPSVVRHVTGRSEFYTSYTPTRPRSARVPFRPPTTSSPWSATSPAWMSPMQACMTARPPSPRPHLWPADSPVAATS